jgi:hypothetical protein
MKQKITLVVILLALITAGIAKSKPDLNGTWVRKAAPDAEKNKQDMVIQLEGDNIHIVYHIEDTWKRTLDLKGKTDGKPHAQTALNAPATLIAKWDGADFVFEIIREPNGGYIHSRRQFKFSADGKSFTTEATYLLKDGKVRNTEAETWEKQ